jgi:hypothetical protein
MKHNLTTTLRYVNENICIEGDSNGSKSLYERVVYSYIWMPYSEKIVTLLHSISYYHGCTGSPPSHT